MAHHLLSKRDNSSDCAMEAVPIRTGLPAQVDSYRMSPRCLSRSCWLHRATVHFMCQHLLPRTLSQSDQAACNSREVSKLYTHTPWCVLNQAQATCGGLRQNRIGPSKSIHSFSNVVKGLTCLR